MQKSTSTLIKFHIFCILIFFVFSGCGTSLPQQSIENLTLNQMNYLYEDLRKNHPNYENFAFAYKGIIKFYESGNDVWLVWMTESSPVGEGIIGAYDSNLTLQDVRITKPIINITKAKLSGDINVLLLKERSKWGIGIYGETMHILEFDNLKGSLWYGEIKSWSEGLLGRNEGHLLHAVVMLLDINNDEKKELVVIKSKQMGTYDDRNILYGDRDIKCSIFNFNIKKHKFVELTNIQPDILYPALLKGKEPDLF